MSETNQKWIIQEGIEIGRVEGEIKGRIKTIQQLLKIRFGHVPERISTALASYTDCVALGSLFELAATCNSVTVFEEAMK